MITVRAVRAEDRAAWDLLYAGYAAFYKVEQTPAMRDTVWGWLLDAGHSSEALVADLDGVLVGLAHFRTFARPGFWTICLWGRMRAAAVRPRR